MKHIRSLIAAAFLASSFAIASTDFNAPPGRQSFPLLIAVGPDGNLWIAENVGQKIARVTLAGVITEFPIAGAQGLTGIVAGPDGNMWFTDSLLGKVGHIAVDGSGFTQFKLPFGSHPQGITAGPDGNLWFVEQELNGFTKIGKITTSGAITEYATRLNAGPFQAYPVNPAVITTGSDGNLWFVNNQATNFGTFAAGKITTAGAVTLYLLQDGPVSITSGPDGNLWITESTHHVAKLTTSGVETEYLIPGSNVSDISAGPDGNLWFTTTRRVGNISTSGAVTLYPNSRFPHLRFAAGIVAAPDGALWFLGSVSADIYRFTTAGQLTNTYLLNSGATPVTAANGPDGAVWFTEFSPSAIGRIAPNGVITSFPLPNPQAQPRQIATGSDGNLWFTEDSGAIARITTSGVVTEFPTSGFSFSLTEGPDGNIWFPESPGFIARITPAGVITQFPLPNPASNPEFITTGPDGNLWFTEDTAIGCITTSGIVLHEYTIPPPGGLPSAIATGPDGNLWFLENNLLGGVAKVTTSGAFTQYPIHLQNFPQGLKAGTDGALWFTEGYPNNMGRVTTNGAISEVALSTPNSVANDLVFGPDGRMWVADAGSGAISRLSAISGTGAAFNAFAGVNFTGNVATFLDGTPAAVAANFFATVSWGDGAYSPGSISGPPGGPFIVTGNHIYAHSGVFTVQVSLFDRIDKSFYLASKNKATVSP